MKKKIFISLGVVVVLIAIGMAYLNHRNRTLSPAGESRYADNNFDITINYSRPSVRGRLIFGPEADNALQPYDTYWRMGANEGTEITLGKDVVVEDNPVLAGTYRIYGYPYPDYFDLVFSRATGEWGYSEPDHEEDLFTVRLPVVRDQEPVEQYTITITEEAMVATINFAFSDYQFDMRMKPLKR